MDKQAKRQGKVGSLRVPWTGWSLVRTKDISKSIASNSIRASIIRRLLKQVDEQAKIIRRWAIDNKVVKVG